MGEIVRADENGVRHVENVSRPRGVTVARLDFAPLVAEIREEEGIPDDHSVRFGHEPYAYRDVAEGLEYVICEEGVGWEVAPDKPLRVPIYVSRPGHMSIAPKWEFWLAHANLDLYVTDELVDLADFIRSFGARLEDNFALWYRRLS